MPVWVYPTWPTSYIFILHGCNSEPILNCHFLSDMSLLQKMTPQGVAHFLDNLQRQRYPARPHMGAHSTMGLNPKRQAAAHFFGLCRFSHQLKCVTYAPPLMEHHKRYSHNNRLWVIDDFFFFLYLTTWVATMSAFLRFALQSDQS